MGLDRVPARRCPLMPKHSDSCGAGGRTEASSNEFDPFLLIKFVTHSDMELARNDDRERKSSGSETTFCEDLIDPVQIEAGVIAMAHDVWAWCEKGERSAAGRSP